MTYVIDPATTIRPPDPFVMSVEKQSFTTNGNTDIITNLTLGQDYSQCVPFLELKASTYTSTASCIMKVTPAIEMINNAGTAATKLLFYSDTIVDNAVLEITIVEFGPDINVQSGAFDAGLTVDYRFNFPVPVNRASTFAIIHTQYTNQSDYTARWCNFCEVFSNTQLRVYSPTPNSTSNRGYWYAVEDTTDGGHFQVTHAYSGYWAQGVAAPYDVSISAVDLNKTMLISTTGCSGWYNYGDTGTFYTYFLNNTTIRTFRSNASRGGIWPRHQIVQFANNTTVQNIAVQEDNSTAGTGKNITISSVDTSKSMVLSVPYRIGRAALTYGNYYQPYERGSLRKLTSPTNINVSRKTAQINTAFYERYSLQVITWDHGT